MAAEVELSAAAPYSLAHDEEDTDERFALQPVSDAASTLRVSASAAPETKKTARTGYHGVTPELEQLFLTMHYRKMQRDLNGPQKKKTRYHFIALACMLILIYGMSSYVTEGGDGPIVISLTITQIALIGVWIFVSIVVTSILGGSKFIVLLSWMLVYWPLLAMMASILIYSQRAVFGAEAWITYALIAVEAVTLITFIVINYAYPKLIMSRWFREAYGAARFWRITLTDDSTMEYDGMWGRLSKRYQCRYVGEVKDGLPNGQGLWSDDSYNGEVLTGTWENGNPVAPFSSRQYGGKGNTFSAVRLAFYMATDDSFEANKLIPTNVEAPRCGVGSVECSIAGEFYSNLPEAALVVGPQTDGDGLTIGDCCRQLGCKSSMEEPVTALQISSNDPRGIQIGGYRYAPTGLPFTKRIKEIIVNVTRQQEHQYQGVEFADRDAAAIQAEDIESSDHEVSPSSTTFQSSSSIQLGVKNWVRVRTKDALVFIPGFNSWLKHSLETFGQMVAMTNLSQHVYPICFAYPGGQVPTYRHASFISATENNKRYFLQMLRGLQSEGIQNIHIVTHSLGVQTLMSVFQDNNDGSPTSSLVSRCFGPAPTHEDQSPSVAELGKLVCRSITLLNPDYPVLAFREHGFRSIRRVASLITVVGDKTDQALWWSSVLNGITSFCGYSPPSPLDSEARKQEKGFKLQQPIGRDIYSLYVEGDKDESIVAFKQSGGSGLASAAASSDAGKSWLDCDVIDTTGLDTNVNNLRHAAFSVNSILLRDIEEIIVTAKRSSGRTTLLHKRGNVYEYCHAPSFVTPQ